MSRTAVYTEHTFAELAHMASRSGVDQNLVLESARQTVELFHQQWQRQKAHLPLSAQVIQAVEQQLLRVPLARGQPGR